MKAVDFLIIGGSAAGTTAAEVIRGLKPEASISIINEENHEQYSRVLLPHYIRHKIGREQVFLKKAQWYSEKNIDFIKGVRAHRLEVSSKKVSLSNGGEIEYGKLLLAVGGEVMKLDVGGSDLENILYLRTIEDGDRLINACRGGKKGIVIGGGFVSLDFATGFRLNGIEEVTVLVRDEYFWSKHLDHESSLLMQNILGKNGVKVVTHDEVDHFEAKGGRSLPETPQRPSSSSVGQVVTKAGKKLDVDVVGVGIGIKLDLDWISSTGVKINRAVLTNEYLETNIPDIYAAGDCSEFHDVFFERQHVMGNWANAISQGLAVAKNMCGVKTVYETISSYSDTFFDPPAGGAYSFIGVTDESYADKVIKRGSVEAGKMARIFVKSINGTMRIVGASIINDPSEVSPISSLIRSKKDISSDIENFSDPNFDLLGIS